jgi:hypothetical protein
MHELDVNKHINTIYIKLRKKKSDHIKKKMFAKKKN